MRKSKFSDSQRLDWLIAHPGHEFSRNADTSSQLRFWLSASFDHDFLPGFYIANGGTERSCIDQAIRMEVKPA